MISPMTEENPARRTDDGRNRDPDNAVFKAAIDNVFKNAAKRGKKHGAGAAFRGRKARKRADDVKQRQPRRKFEH